MPELPEVETMRRGIVPIEGQRIVRAERPRCRLRPITLTPRIDVFSRRVRERRIEAVQRRGKRLLIALDDGQTIVIEPRMTGLVLLADPPGVEHLRWRLELADGVHGELLFWDRRGLGTVRLFRPAELEAALGADRVGPDALQIAAAELQRRLGRSRRAVKVALLDQRAVAGIGNLYASEILHVAGVDPRAACASLSVRHWQRIQAAIGAVLAEAIAHEGSTLSDGTYRNALNQSGSYQNLHRVYDRASAPCRGCRRGTIVRIVQGGRSTFFCQRCQR